MQEAANAAREHWQEMVPEGNADRRERRRWEEEMARRRGEKEHGGEGRKRTAKIRGLFDPELASLLSYVAKYTVDTTV